jgi:hypothetical protein
MDSLAKVYWKAISEEQVVGCAIASGYWPVDIRGGGGLDKRMREHILSQAQWERWEQKGWLMREQIERVNWKACDQSMRSLTIGW